MQSLDRPGREAVSTFLTGVLGVYAEILDGDADNSGTVVTTLRPDLQQAAASHLGSHQRATLIYRQEQSA